MTTKLTIEIAVIHCNLTLVAKYAFSQALSHLEIRLAGSEGDSTTGYDCLMTHLKIMLQQQELRKINDRRAPWVSKYGAPMRTKYRLRIENLSTGVGWQVGCMLISLCRVDVC